MCCFCRSCLATSTASLLYCCADGAGHTCLKSGVAKQRGTADCSCILPRMVWLLTSCCWNKVREPLRMIYQPGRLVRNTIMSWRMTSVKLPTLWTAERVFYARLALFFRLCATNRWSKKKFRDWEIFKNRRRLASLHHNVLCNGSFTAWITSKGLLRGSYIMQRVTQGQLHAPALVKDIFLAQNLFPSLHFPAVAETVMTSTDVPEKFCESPLSNQRLRQLSTHCFTLLTWYSKSVQGEQ